MKSAKVALSSLGRPCLAALLALSLASPPGLVAFAHEAYPTVLHEEDASRSMLDEFMRSLPSLGAQNGTKTLRVIVKAQPQALDRVKGEALAIPGTRLGYEYSQVFSGFSLDIPRGGLDKLGAIQGIEALDLSDPLEPAMVDAKRLTHVIEGIAKYKQAHADQPDLDGRGMVIATLDSGVDLESEDLQLDAADTESGVDEAVFNELKIKDTLYTTKSGKPNYKIPYAYNYFRGDSSPEGIMDKVARPHGMHIAGILAGNSGVPGSGFKGVAPNAQLLVYKVITYDRKSSTRPDLVEYVGEDAVFHAMDDAITRHADVISLSVGNQGTGSSQDIWNSAVEKAYEAGVVVVGAMGNWASSTSDSSYDSFADDGIGVRDSSSAVSVAAHPHAIGVGSTYNTHLQLPSLDVDGKLSLAYQTIGKFTPRFLEGIHHELDTDFVYVDRGMQDRYVKDKDFSDIRDKVVVVKRGGEAMKDKIVRFLKQGARGVILINAATDDWRANTDIYPVIGYNHLTIEDGWAVGISGNDGQKLLDYMAAQDTVAHLRFNPQPSSVELNGSTGMSGFSSWGPNHNLDIKPDVVATGENIYSLANEGAYTILSGTSMASPHAAGIATLLLQSLKSKDAAFFESLHIKRTDYVKTMLMNTAQVLMDAERESGEDVHEYATRRQGAGQVNLARALASEVLLTYGGTSGGISLREISEPRRTFSIDVHNFASEPRSFRIHTSGVLHEVSVERTRHNENGSYTAKTLHTDHVPGADITGPEQIVIPAQTSVSLDFVLTLGEARDEFVEGYLYFESLNETQPSLNMPFMGFAGAWNAEAVFDSPAWDDQSKTKLSKLYSVVPGHHGSNEYIEMGLPGNIVEGSETPEQGIQPDLFALTNKGKKFRTSIVEAVPRVIFLRSVDTYEAAIVSEAREDAPALKVLNVAHQPRKYIRNIHLEGGEDYGIPNELEKWNGRYYDPATGGEVYAPEGQYYFRYKAWLQGRSDAPHCIYLPIKVDNQNPTIESVTFDRSQSNLAITTSDNLGIWKLSVSLDGRSQEVIKLSENSYEVRGLTLSQLTENKLKVEAMDCAGNQAEAYESALTQADPPVKIENLSRVLKRIDKRVKISHPQNVTVHVSNTQGANLELSELSTEDGRITESFAVADLGEDTSFVVTWNQEGISVREQFKLELVSIEKEEHEPEFSIPLDEPFTAHDTSLYAGFYRHYNNLDDESYEGNYIDYEEEDGIVRNMKLHFVLHLHEGQRAEVTNVNVAHNRALGLGHEPISDPYTVSWDDGVEENEHWIAVDNGVNTINLKVYQADPDSGDERLVYNKGFFVYIDAVLPGLKLDDEHIVYNPDYDGDTDEFVGTIYSSDGHLKLSGSYEDNLDGAVLRVNGSVVDRISLPGETGYNRAPFATELNLADGDTITIEVKDASDNLRLMRFKHRIDSEAPALGVQLDEETSLTGESVLERIEHDEYDEDYDLPLVRTEIQVNGSEYAGGPLSAYALTDKPGYFVVIRSVDKAGNETRKELLLEGAHNTMRESLSCKKDAYTRQELSQVTELFDTEPGVTYTIRNISIAPAEDEAALTVEARDSYGHVKTHMCVTKLVSRQYKVNPDIAPALLKHEYRVGERLESADLFGTPSNLAIVVLDKISVDKPGEVEFRVAFYKGSEQAEQRYRITVLPELVSVRFDALDGSAVQEELLSKGDVLDLGTRIPQRQGYEFLGWYREPSFEHRVDDVQLITPLVLYARWRKLSSPQTPDSLPGEHQGVTDSATQPGTPDGPGSSSSPAPHVSGTNPSSHVEPVVSDHSPQGLLAHSGSSVNVGSIVFPSGGRADSQILRERTPSGAPRQQEASSQQNASRGSDGAEDARDASSDTSRADNSPKQASPQDFPQDKQVSKQAEQAELSYGLLACALVLIAALGILGFVLYRRKQA